MLDQCGGVQWPWPVDSGAAGIVQANPAAERRLFEDGLFYHADGKARFIFDLPQPLPEPVDPAYPLTLLTGRGSSAQWHTQTRTAKSAVLRRLYPAAPYVEINQHDALELRINTGDIVAVISRRGRMEANPRHRLGLRRGVAAARRLRAGRAGGVRGGR